MSLITPKAFVDFFISFSGEDLTGDFLRTDSPLRQIAEYNGKWKMYIQQNSDLALFHTAGNDRYCLWCFGEIFQYKDKGCNDINKILEAFLNDLLESREKPGELNGHFLIICWDSKEKIFFVWTNRLGTYHAYYSLNNQNRAIGSFSPHLYATASGKELDWIGIAGLFGFGFFPKDRTHFEDIKIFLPASCYEFDENGKLIRQQRYWRWNHIPDRNRSYIDTVLRFGNILENILDDYTRDGKIALPISGGLDSRTVASLVPNNRRIWSFSYGWSKDSAEINIAEKVAKIRNFPFRSFVIEPYIFDKLDLIMKSVEGFQDLLICRQASVVEELYANADYLLVSHWGDVWNSSMGAIGRKLKLDEITRLIFKKTRKHYYDWLLENIVKPKLKNDPEEILHDIVEEQAKDYEDIEEIDFRIKAIKTDSWSFRWTLASIRMYQPACFPRLPFYDNRIVDFFLTVPSEYVKDRKLQIDYLKYFKPEFAKVKWQVYDANLLRYKYFNSWLLPKRIFNKVQRIIRRKTIIERNWEKQFLSNAQGRQGLEKNLLSQGLKIHEFVPASKINPLINGLFSGKISRDTGYSLSMLLTFSAWLEENA